MASTSSSPSLLSPDSTVDHFETDDYNNEKRPESATSKNPVQVARRNARERSRVHQVNQGFKTLQKHIPTGNKKPSKVETLRQAALYIEQLARLLGNDAMADNQMLVNLLKQDSNTSYQYPNQMHYPMMENHRPYQHSYPNFPQQQSYVNYPPQVYSHPQSDTSSGSYLSDHSMQDLALSPLQMTKLPNLPTSEVDFYIRE